jgi:predicted Zn-dependent protease
MTFSVTCSPGERPVFTQEQLLALAKRVLSMSSADTTSVRLKHVARVVTRVANGRVLPGEDGDELVIAFRSRYGEGIGVELRSNQLDDTSLRVAVAQCEALSQQNIRPIEPILPEWRDAQDTFLPVHLWHDETVRAMATTRDTIIPEVTGRVTHAGLRASATLGLMARVDAILTKDGIMASAEETDSELTVTARHANGAGSGWGGQAARDSARIRPSDVAQQAVDIALRSANPVAIEPGRRTAILSAAAVAQIIRFLWTQLEAEETNKGFTGLSRKPSGSKLGERVFDERLTMTSAPDDPDGGYRPYAEYWGWSTPRMTWIERGILKNLRYEMSYAMAKGKPYAVPPASIRVSGGTTSIEQMIAQCEEGVFVNRFSGVELLDRQTGLMTGVTRDGCFLIKRGKIDRPVKNLRFLESPFFFMNRIDALGVPVRAAFGYTPPSYFEWAEMVAWPRQPVIVPPMMVHDFNFNALIDAI